LVHLFFINLNFTQTKTRPIHHVVQIIVIVCAYYIILNNIVKNNYNFFVLFLKDTDYFQNTKPSIQLAYVDQSLYAKCSLKCPDSFDCSSSNIFYIYGYFDVLSNEDSVFWANYYRRITYQNFYDIKANSIFSLMPFSYFLSNMTMVLFIF